MVLNCPNLGFCSLVYETLAGVWGHFPQRGNYATVLRLGWQDRPLGRTVSFARILILLSDDWEEREKLEVRLSASKLPFSPPPSLHLCIPRTVPRGKAKTARKQQKATCVQKAQGQGRPQVKRALGRTSESKVRHWFSHILEERVRQGCFG